MEQHSQQIAQLSAGVEDDEILLGCKSPEDESNIDLRPVTNLGFASRFSSEQAVGHIDTP